MTETEWLACKDPIAMLPGLADTRALRLYAAAGCRRVWHLLNDTSRRAVEVAERFADGKATEEERRAACDAATTTLRATEALAYDCVGNGLLRSSGIAAAAAAANAVAECWTFDGQQAELFYLTFNPAEAHELDKEERGEPIQGLRTSEFAAHADLLRDIFGNPFRPVSVEPAWLAWNDGTIPKIAQAIHDERHLPSGHLDATRLAILEDALEEAGCDDPELLRHCRSAGIHVRGCWVVDHLLGKA